MPPIKSSSQRPSATAKKRSARKATGTTTQPPPSFPIVAVGASAGGLDAFTRLLRHLPADTGMAFVLLQHLDARHTSQLPELLARATSLPVVEASDGQTLQPNHIFVMPPNVQMALAGDVLRLTPRTQTGGVFKPIDTFCESLARDRGHRAIGVILSGTGTDGTLGLKAIKAAGGVTFAQDEESAQFRGMPQSAARAGVADFVLAPEAVGRRLAELLDHPYVQAPVKPATDAAELPAPEPALLRRVMDLLKTRTGVDLAAYKPATLGRRVQRRIMLNDSRSLAAYLELLHDQPDELDRLYEDVFIHVTSFFRDPEVYDVLQRKIFPKLIQTRAAGVPVRLWVPGCSTGEEAYSLAMAWLEVAEREGHGVPLQIFGTDISAAAIDVGRAGRYPEGALAGVSPERLRQFFVKAPGGYRVAKQVRDVCVFATHNLLRDPPFTQLDLLCCRNVLIYLQPEFQQKILQLCHYALRPSGFMVLGTSEDIGPLTDLFAVADKRVRIYAKKPAVGLHWHELFRPNPPGSQGPSEKWAGARPPSELTDTHLVVAGADRIALSKYVPASVIVDAELDIVEYRGQVGRFLEPAPGQPSRSLGKMLRGGLNLVVPKLVRQAHKTNTATKQAGLRLTLSDGQDRPVTVEVTPFQASPRSSERYFLVTFQEELVRVASAAQVSKPRRGKAADAARRLAELEQSLDEARTIQQSALQERDAYNQELLAALEELQSANEELQSTNEELQSAKEELQSTNEELTTLNEELENRNNELGQTLGHLTNIVESVRIPIVIVDPGLRIRLFNPAAERVLSVVATDMGRSIGDVKTRLNQAELEPLIRDVMDTLQPYEAEVQDREGRWYAMRIRPYKSLENRIDGAVLTWSDISILKTNLSSMTDARDFLAAIVSTVHQALLILDPDLRVVTANQAFYDLFRLTSVETERRVVFELGDGQWDIPELHQLLEEILLETDQFHGLEIERDFALLGRRSVLINARRVQPVQAQGELILLTIEDVTAVKQLTEMRQFRQLSGRLQAAREDERASLSREIHDELGAALTGLKMQLHQVNAGLTEAQAPLRAVTADMSGLIDQELNYVRGVAASLRPHLLDDMGLKAAIEWQLDEFQKQTGLAVHVRGDIEAGVLAPEAQTAAFRIFQEALTNVARHAEARTVGVTLEVVDDQLQLIVHDDGKGLPPAAQAGAGSMGLAGMRERARQLGGTLQIWSAPGQGTSVRVRLPLQPMTNKE